MAKDGTNRGGRRVRAGDKPDTLADKIANGREATVREFPMTELNGAELTNAADLYGEEMPQPSEYLSASIQPREERFPLPSFRWRTPIRNRTISCGTRSLKS